MIRQSWLHSSSFHPLFKSDASGFMLILVSHLANLFPIFLAFTRPLPVLFRVILIAQTIGSIVYHSFPLSSIARGVDWVLAIALTASNLTILIKFNSGNVLLTKLCIIVPLVLISFYIFSQFENYPQLHSLWHVLSAIITSVVIW